MSNANHRLSFTPVKHIEAETVNSQSVFANTYSTGDNISFDLDGNSASNLTLTIEATNAGAGTGNLDMNVDDAFTLDCATFSIDSSSTTGASNLSHVGAAGQDLTVACTAGSLNLTGAEAAADAVQITASNAAGGIRLTAGTNNVVVPATFQALDINQSAATGSTTAFGTLDTAGGAQTISAAELISGYTYRGAAGGGVALTFPTATAVQTALAAKNITTAAGLRLPDVIVSVTDANNLTITAGDGTETVVATDAAINNETAVCKYVFSGAATALIIVIRNTA